MYMQECSILEYIYISKNVPTCPTRAVSHVFSPLGMCPLLEACEPEGSGRFIRGSQDSTFLDRICSSRSPSLGETAPTPDVNLVDPSYVPACMTLLLAWGVSEVGREHSVPHWTCHVITWNRTQASLFDLYIIKLNDRESNPGLLIRFISN